MEKGAKMAIAVLLIVVVAIPTVGYAFGRFRLSSTVSEHPISLTVELTKNEYAVGEVVTIGFTLTNIGEDPIVVTFPNFPLFDFEVMGIKGEIIYKSMWDLADFFMIVELELNPGQSTHDTLSWIPSIPGLFTVIGYTENFKFGRLDEGSFGWDFILTSRPITFSVNYLYR